MLLTRMQQLLRDRKLQKSTRSKQNCALRSGPRSHCRVLLLLAYVSVVVALLALRQEACEILDKLKKYSGARQNERSITDDMADFEIGSILLHNVTALKKSFWSKRTLFLAIVKQVVRLKGLRRRVSRPMGSGREMAADISNDGVRRGLLISLIGWSHSGAYVNRRTSLEWRSLEDVWTQQKRRKQWR